MSNKPFVLCILDGWGLSNNPVGNAPMIAKTPNFDYLLNNFSSSVLTASGEAVGLPDGQMGNSEVGHMNLGAGRVVYTGLSLVNNCIKEGKLLEQPAVKEFFDLVKSKNKKLHFISLISRGGVHSNMDHFFEFARLSKKLNQPYILHAFTDGRDVSPFAAKEDFSELKKVLDETSGKLGVVSGRYFAMDRDKNWDREEKVFKYMVGSDSSNTFDDVVEYIQSSYKSEVTDEFIAPAICKDNLDCIIEDGDVIVFLNFRPDRAKQLSHMLVGSDGIYDYSPSKILNDVSLFSMMEYEKINTKNVLFLPFDIKNTIGEVLNRAGLSQLRISETEKYPHVTHFFDGGKGVEYPKMKKILVPSPKVATYDLQPEMSSSEVGEKLIQNLPNFDVVILNFANPDMVGHTGSLDAAVKACESVDYQLGLIYNKVEELGGMMMIIADHGNAEVMVNPDGSVNTAHTTNLVPVIITKKGLKLRDDGILGDVSPTILHILGIQQPIEMTGKTLLLDE